MAPFAISVETNAPPVSLGEIDGLLSMKGNHLGPRIPCRERVIERWKSLWENMIFLPLH